MSTPTASSLRRLIAWRPIQALWGLLAVVVAVPAVRMMMDAGHFAPGGLQVETQGASGQIAKGQVHLDLPVSVYNGSDRVITGLSLWVQAYACPTQNSPLDTCARILSTGQDVPIRLMPGGSLHSGRTITIDAPAGLPGDAIRIVRRVDNVADDHDEMDNLREQRLDQPIR